MILLYSYLNIYLFITLIFSNFILVDKFLIGDLMNVRSDLIFSAAFTFMVIQNKWQDNYTGGTNYFKK
jgi:hypothetical protein